VTAFALGKYPIPISRKLHGHQSQTGDYEKEKNLLPLLRREPQLLACPALSLVYDLQNPNNSDVDN
jgi:hypothetical protein